MLNPRIDLDVPKDWQFKEQITVVHDPSATDGLNVNVIASSEQLGPGLETDAYVDSMTSKLQSEFPAFRQLQLERMNVFGGRPGWLRRFEWEPEPGLSITQLQAYYTEGERAYTATATAETKDFEQCQRDLIDVLMSLELRDQDQPSTAATTDRRSASVS